MKRRIILFILALLFLVPALLAARAEAARAGTRAPEIEWWKTYAIAAGDHAEDIRPTSDGGYILLVNYSDPVLMKLKETGDIEWIQYYRGELGENGQYAHSVCENVYGYAFTGLKDFKTGEDSFINKVFITQTDGQGNPLWSKTYGASWTDSDSFGSSIEATQDGGLIVTGELEPDFPNPSGDYYVYLLKTDAGGNMQWETTASEGSQSTGHSVQQCRDGGYIVAGEKAAGREDHSRAALFKFSGDGSLLWEKTYIRPGETSSSACCVRETAGGGFVITDFVAYTPDEGSFAGIYLRKTDANGNMQWEKPLWENSMLGESDAPCVITTADGGFVVAGSRRVEPTQIRVGIYIVRTDGGGNPVWEKNIAEENPWFYNWPVAIRPTDDGGFILAGGRVDAELLNYDAVAIKLGPETLDVEVKGAAFLDTEGGTMNILASAECADDGALDSGNTASSDATYRICDSAGNPVGIEGTLSYDPADGKWKAVNIDVSSVMDRVAEAKIEFTDQNGHSGNCVSKAIQEAVLTLSSPNALAGGRVLIAATLLDVDGNRITSGKEGIYARIGGETVALADSGQNGDMNRKDGVYSAWQKVEESYPVISLLLGEEVCSAVTVNLIHDPDLVVLTDFKALFDNFLFIGLPPDDDQDTDQLIDYYEAMGALYEYAAAHHGVIIDLKQEITTDNGFASNYRSLAYGEGDNTREMNRLIDRLVYNISTQSAFKNIVLVGDDAVLPYYRRTSPENEADYTGEMGGANGNITLEDTGHNYIMTDVPYATYNLGPDLVARPRLDAGFGRIFADSPQGLYEMIAAYQTPLALAPGRLTAGIFSPHPDTVEWPVLVNNALMPVMSEYGLQPGALGGAVPGRYYHYNENQNWGSAEVGLSVERYDATFLWTHAGHLGAMANNGNHITHETFPSAPGTLFISSGCHSGYTVSYSAFNPALYDSLALGALTKGLSYFAPTTYGMGVDEAVAYHDLLEQQFAKELIRRDTIGEALIHAYYDYWDRILPASADSMNTYAAYGIGYYGLPTQAIGHGQAEGRQLRALPPAEKSGGQLQDVSAAIAAGAEIGDEHISVTIPAIEARGRDGRVLFAFGEGGEQLIEAYCPILPMYVKSYIYPQGTVIDNVSLVDQVISLYDGGAAVELALAEPVHKTKGPLPGEATLHGGLYPQSVFWWETRETANGTELFISMVPVQYDANNGQASIYHRMDFAVEIAPPEPPDDMILVSVTPPAAVTGVANGTLKADWALGLLFSVTLVTDYGNISAGVTWDVASCAYDPATLNEQTFTVDGTVNLPDNVHNPNGVSLDVSVSVTVNAAPPMDLILVSVTPPAAVTGLANGTAKTAAALGLPATVKLVTDEGNVSANVTWDVASSSYDPADTDEQTFTVDGVVTLPGNVHNTSDISLEVSVSVTVSAATSTDKTLVSVTPPAAITGLANGTAKTAAALGLPATVTLVTDGGNVSASVIWDVASSAYDPADTDEQTFTVGGTVTLPNGVVNPDGVSLEVSINVTVSAATSADKTLVSVTPPAAITGLANGTAKTAVALGLPATVTLVTDGVNVSAGVTWDVASCAYDPSDTGEQTFTVDGTATLPNGVVNPNGVSLSINIEVTVNAAPETPPGIAPTITTLTLANGTVGMAYSQTIAASGNAPITWTKDGGSLPDGLTLSSGGVISGTPTTAGTFSFTVRATNHEGDDTQALSIVISSAAPVTYTITASAGSGGSISPNGTVSVAAGGSQTFTITPNSSYSIASVRVDGTNQGTISSYTFTNVTGNHTIGATFSYTGGGSTGGGGGSAPAPKTSIISDVVETAADKAMDKVLIEEKKAVLSLAGGSSNTAQISAAVIARLAEHETTFALENTGVRLDFAPGALSVAQVTGGPDGALVEIGAREVTGTEREGILAQAPAGQSTGLFEIGGRIFDLTALVRTGEGAGQRIEGFGAPVAVTIDLSHLGDLTPEQISQLTGVRLEKDDEGNTVPVILGGQYDPATRTFTFNTDTFSLYTVMRLEQAAQRLVVELAVGSAAASVNGSPYALDAPPRVAEGRTLVPVRFVSEALGAKVTWDAATRRITVTDAGKVIVLTLGSSQALVDGEARAIDCPPATLPPGRAFVPLRFVSETLGAQVDYDNKQITITR